MNSGEPGRWFSPGGAGGAATGLFLPGWAFSGRVLLLAESAPAWAFPDFVPDTASLSRRLLAFLDGQGIGRVHLAGWSLGAHLALDFALDYPQRVASLELMAMRASWPAEEIGAIRQGLRHGEEEFLRDFYRKCFLGYKKEYRRFVAEQQEELLAGRDMGLLERGLAYLAAWRPSARLPACPVRCWQGRRDVIAPASRQPLFVGAEVRLLEHGGHALFLDRELAEL